MDLAAHEDDEDANVGKLHYIFLTLMGNEPVLEWCVSTTRSLSRVVACWVWRKGHTLQTIIKDDRIQIGVGNH